MCWQVADISAKFVTQFCVTCWKLQSHGGCEALKYCFEDLEYRVGGHVEEPDPQSLEDGRHLGTCALSIYAISQLRNFKINKIFKKITLHKHASKFL